MPTASEEDPKETTRIARKDPLTEKTLRQFLSLESCNANSRAYIANYDVAVGRVVAPTFARMKCRSCEYTATTSTEIDFHERLPGHDEWSLEDN